MEFNLLRRTLMGMLIVLLMLLTVVQAWDADWSPLSFVNVNGKTKVFD
jgi:hypothetical protein